MVLQISASGAREPRELLQQKVLSVFHFRSNDLSEPSTTFSDQLTAVVGVSKIHNFVKIESKTSSKVVHLSTVC